MVLTVSLVHIFQQPFQTIKTYYNQIREKDDVVKISELIDEHIGITLPIKLSFNRHVIKLVLLQMNMALNIQNIG